MRELSSKHPDVVKRLLCTDDARSLHGVLTEQLLTAVEAHLRCGDPGGKARWSLLEIHAQCLVTPSSPGSLKAKLALELCTRLGNLLAIMAVEDCLEPGMLHPFAKEYSTWAESKTSIQGLTCLLRMYEMIKAAKKGRVVSFIKLLVLRDCLSADWQTKWASEVTPPAALDFRTWLRDQGDIVGAALLPKVPFNRLNYLPFWTHILSLFHSDPEGKAAILALQALQDGHADEQSDKRVYFIYHATFLMFCAKRGWLKDPEVWRVSAPDAAYLSEDNAETIFEAHLADQKRTSIMWDHPPLPTLTGADEIDMAFERREIENRNEELLPHEVDEVIRSLFTI